MGVEERPGQWMKITERQGKGGMNMSKYIMQLWENEVKPESLRSLSYLVFPFHSFTEQGTKMRANVTVVVRGAAPANRFISHVQ